jgi:hypothetical protein
MTLTLRGACVPALALAGLLFASSAALAQDAAPVPIMSGVTLPGRTMDDLVRMPRAELEALYLSSPAASQPSGFLPGRAIKNPGSRRTERNSRTTGLVWKGKIFRDDGTMVNRLAGGLTAIPAQVYAGESWLDGRPSLILDYSGSRLWPDVRDEIREVSPGLYLGIMYRTRSGRAEQVMFFTLDARQ